MVPDALLPEWVPNAHPLIVHFPIALLVVTAAVDAAALALRDRWRHGFHVGTGLHVLTGLSAVVTYYSGQWGVEQVIITPDAAPVLADHMTAAWYTMLVTGVYGLARLGTSFVPAVRRRLALHAAVVLIGFAGLYPLWKAGENGGELVYKHGIGVEAAEPPIAEDTSSSSSPADTTQAP